MISSPYTNDALHEIGTKIQGATDRETVHSAGNDEIARRVLEAHFWPLVCGEAVIGWLDEGEDVRLTDRPGIFPF